MKCNQSRLEFELVSPCPFPTTITITPRAPLLPLLPGPLWLRVVVFVWGLIYIGHIDLFNHSLYLKAFNYVQIKLLMFDNNTWKHLKLCAIKCKKIVTYYLLSKTCLFVPLCGVSSRREKCDMNSWKETCSIGSWEGKVRPHAENELQNRKSLIEHNLLSCLDIKY